LVSSVFAGSAGFAASAAGSAGLAGFAASVAGSAGFAPSAGLASSVAVVGAGDAAASSRAAVTTACDRNRIVRLLEGWDGGDLPGEDQA